MVSQKWAKTAFKINGEVVWSRDYWSELFEPSKTINTYVTHVSAHQKDDSEETTFNNIADRLTRDESPKWKLPQRHRKLPAKFKDYEVYPAKVSPITIIKRDNEYAIKTEMKCGELSPGAILGLHK